MIIHDSNLHSITEFSQDADGNRVLPTILENSGVQTVHLDVQNLTGTTGFILISLRGTSSWKHTATNLIHLDWLAVNVNPTSSFRGDVHIGFLSNTAASRGDFHIIKTWHFDQVGNGLQAELSFLGSHFLCSSNYHFGPIVANDATFGNSISLQCPNGYFYPGQYDGDLVMKITRTAGNTDVGVTIGYHTS